MLVSIFPSFNVIFFVMCFTHVSIVRINSLLNPVRWDMAEAHCGAAFEWYQQTSSDSFTPRRAGCISAAVTPAIRAGGSYHRTQAFLLLAHCCCHSSAPPERLPHSPHHADSTHTNETRTKGNETQIGKEKIMREAFVEEGKLNEQVGRFKNKTMARSSREVA